MARSYSWNDAVEGFSFMKNKISVQVLTHNCEDTLSEVLQSLSAFSEIVIIDTGSTDNTLSIAAQFPKVCIYQTEFKGFGSTRNEGATHCSHDWIFAVDADEIVSNELCMQILYGTLNPGLVYSVRRRNYFNGKEIKCTHWGNDFVLRLYHKKNTQFSTDRVHERVLTQNNNIRKLKGHLTHVPYRSISDFLRKMECYSSLYAEQYQGKKGSSLGKAIWKGVFTFLKNYFIQRGCLGGGEGFVLSLYNAQTTYYKYLKLAEINRII